MVANVSKHKMLMKDREAMALPNVTVSREWKLRKNMYGDWQSR
jgi:hypothetical protein